MSATINPQLRMPMPRNFAVPARPAESRIARAAVIPLEMTFACAYVALLPYQHRLGPSLQIAFSDFFVILAIICCAARFTFRRAAWSVWHVAILLTFAIGSLMVAVSSGSLSRYVFLNKDAGLAVLFVTYLLITSAVTDWSHLRLLLRTFIKSTVLLNIVTIAGFILSYATNIETPFAAWGSVNGGRRVVGMLLDPNAYGGLLVAAFVLCETAAFGKKPLLDGAWLLISRISLAAGILFTFSRTAWVALFLAMMCLMAIRVRTAIRLAVAAAATVVTAFFLAGDQLSSLMSQMILRKEAGRGRGELVEKALAHFANYPVFGGGLGSYIDEQGLVVHNTAVWFLADFGLFGITAFLGFFIWFWLTARKARRIAPESERPVIEGLMIAHVAMLGLSMGIEAFYQRHWWLVMALMASSYHVALQAYRRKQREVPIGRNLPRYARGTSL